MTFTKFKKSKYFTEEILVDCLVNRYGYSHKVTPQAKFMTGKVDIFVEFNGYPESNFAAEFDGYQHYTKTSQCFKDMMRDKEFSDANIQLVRWPYWIQPNWDTTEHFFGEPKTLQYIGDVEEYREITKYPHGFISNSASCVLPADFCSAGLKRFKEEMLLLPNFISKEVISNLKIRAEYDYVASYSLVLIEDIIKAIEK